MIFPDDIPGSGLLVCFHKHTGAILEDSEDSEDSKDHMLAIDRKDFDQIQLVSTESLIAFQADKAWTRLAS